MVDEAQGGADREPVVSTTQSLTLYFVAYASPDNENQDMFVTATNSLEAFALWRVNQGYAPGDETVPEGTEFDTAQVFEVPAVGTKTRVHWWHTPDVTGEHFSLGLDTLATRALEASYNNPDSKENSNHERHDQDTHTE